MCNIVSVHFMHFKVLVLHFFFYMKNCRFFELKWKVDNFLLQQFKAWDSRLWIKKEDFEYALKNFNPNIIEFQADLAYFSQSTKYGKLLIAVLSSWMVKAPKELPLANYRKSVSYKICDFEFSCPDSTFEIFNPETRFWVQELKLKFKKNTKFLNWDPKIGAH